MPSEPQAKDKSALVLVTTSEGIKTLHHRCRTTRAIKNMRVYGASWGYHTGLQTLRRNW